ncbi:MAG: phenylacetate-CoA oxygenase/reductase subunit PaaK [Rhodobacteraceae bacterium]|nr:phenylacetate-CoA oxygenase/reductase subunit PaaK [Paracoccaceae bacterium]
MTRFLPLTVTAVRRTTPDAVEVTLRPRPEDAEAFRFVQGQYLTFRREFDGEELRRSYSICAGLDDGVLQVGIRRVEGGAFSTWANQALRPGDVLEAMPPAGRFHAPLDPGAARRYLAFAGGSGITPVLSILRTVMAREPLSRFTLVYANRALGTVMFREELEDLKNLHLGRFALYHVLEAEGQGVELFTGRLDAAKLGQLFARLIDPADADLAFVCGPEPMMLAVAEALKAHGMAADRIRFELFASGQPGRARRRPAPAPVGGAPEGGVAAAVTLDGVTRAFRMAPDAPSLLDAALAADLDVPYACKAGVCSTCRAKVIEGRAEMAVNHALEDYEVRAGYVLTCQARPLTDRIAVTYDE